MSDAGSNFFVHECWSRCTRIPPLGLRTQGIKLERDYWTIYLTSVGKFTSKLSCTMKHLANGSLLVLQTAKVFSFLTRHRSKQSFFFLIL